ncbi:hypothetical protein AK812_SmicGene11897 [Symbiodinium microadriaticum]|uniref:Uncharacterized protein n=1 Tax=Symbiodinium microadriaticum TaxID=2951 RepID=A0A1Q9EC46_SYMMI|nr:hypothetical protein AK812_SmicGene11897 [Symbiodinium microadriaticum]
MVTLTVVLLIKEPLSDLRQKLRDTQSVLGQAFKGDLQSFKGDIMKSFAEKGKMVDVVTLDRKENLGV